VAVELYPDGTSTCILGNLADISAAGCCVETPTRIEVGTALRMSPFGHAEMIINGKVVNHRVNTGMMFHAHGVEFSVPSESDVTTRWLELVEEISASDQRMKRYFGEKE